MAAYAALVSLMNDLELIPNHPTHSFSFDEKQIASLSQTVHFLVDFMDSYDSHGCSREAAEVLESRIASAAYAAHDVIESHIIDQIHAGSTRGGKTRSYFLLDLQRSIDKMEFVKRKAMQFQAKSGLKAEQSTYSSSAPATSSEPLKDNGMVGFEEVVNRLVELLTGPSNQRLTIPIVGMGGLGKTSLAKTVYEHSYLEHHFDVRLWATISQQYSNECILTRLLYGVRKSTTDENVSELGEQLHKRLWGRRYLIVLDDMWSLGAWDRLQMFLPDNDNGSRVVVTTRLSSLAAHLSSSPFKLSFLDEDNSWDLFCRQIFGEKECPVELEEIGKRILRRCGGLPLSIVVMAGHLRSSSMSIEYWKKVAGYMNPISSIGEEEQCLEILSLSYQHLPAYLKPCFLYFGIYREDESIHASILLQCWIGEGFLKPKKGLSLEEVGKDCLKDLIDRNLIIAGRSTWNGKVEDCEIHDSVREVCLKICKKEKFMFVVDDSTQVIRSTERRIVILEDEQLNFDTIGGKQSIALLRTLVYRGGNSLLYEMLVDCSLLRVLLCGQYPRWGRDGTCSLFDTCLLFEHLQKVNLRTLFSAQPNLLDIVESISSCWNLQTLNVMIYGTTNLPYQIWEMPQLRHLHVINEDCYALNEGSTHQDCIVMQNLCLLVGVVNLRLTEEVCKRMPNLKALNVAYDRFRDDHCFHNLGRFNKLKLLHIFLNDDPKWRDAALSLIFPTLLEELALYNSHLGWEDLTMMISSLPLLECLRVSSVHGSEWNFGEEEFRCLKTFEISSCPELIYLNANSSHFPTLESLYLNNIPKLSEIPLDMEDISTLRHIELEDCSASAAVSAMRMVMEQETNGNDGLQLHVRLSDSEEFVRFQEMLRVECLTTNSLHLYYKNEKIKTF